MRYLALICDYDGTLASSGQLAPTTLAGLERLRGTGRHLIMVTGRQLDDLQSVCPHLELFTSVVAENGAVLYEPATRKLKLLAEPPHERFVAALRERHVAPLSIGRV